MKVPDMETITESLEKSMQNCSLTDRRRRVGGHGFGRSDERSNQNTPISDRTLELNSHVSLPRHWEQCLDLKTGEIYYINWKNGMKVRDDPRKVMNVDVESSGESSYGTMGSEEDSSYYDSEESSSESSPSSSIETQKEEDDDEAEEGEGEEEDHVLVVAGCKACFMYFMVPKHVEDCPKCAAQLLHFDRSHAASP